MTYYRLKNNLGCVVREFKAWTQADGIPLRLALDAIQNIHMSMKTGVLDVTDVAGYHWVVKPGDFVFEHPSNPRRINVLGAEEFYRQFEVSDA